MKHMFFCAPIEMSGHKENLSLLAHWQSKEKPMKEGAKVAPHLWSRTACECSFSSSWKATSHFAKSGQ